MILGITVRPDKYTKWKAEKLERVPDDLRQSGYDIIVAIYTNSKTIYVMKPCDISIDEVLDCVDIYKSFQL